MGTGMSLKRDMNSTRRSPESSGIRTSTRTRAGRSPRRTFAISGGAEERRIAAEQLVTGSGFEGGRAPAAIRAEMSCGVEFRDGWVDHADGIGEWNALSAEGRGASVLKQGGIAGPGSHHDGIGKR